MQEGIKFDPISLNAGSYSLQSLLNITVTYVIANSVTITSTNLIAENPSSSAISKIYLATY